MRTLLDTCGGELHATQRNLSIYLVDTLRVQSSIALETMAFVIASKPGEPMTTEDFVADEIGTSMEAYSRARAFFMALAFVMISDQTFIENKIFSLVQMTVDRRRSPPSFVAAAWDLCFDTFRRRSNQPMKYGLLCP